MDSVAWGSTLDYNTCLNDVAGFLGEPLIGFSNTTNCDPEGDFGGVCDAPTFTPAVATATPTIGSPTATHTRTPSQSPTITLTPTITGTPTSTPTPTLQSVDNRGVPNLSLPNVACAATPCPFGTPVPAANDIGRVKVSSCELTNGSSTYFGTYCLPHVGHWQGTPIPLGSPVACPGKVEFKDTYEQCMQRIESGTGQAVGYIDRLPDAEVPLAK